MALGIKRWQGWEDMLEMLLALWMIAAPFILGFISEGAASASSIFIGSVIFLVSQLGLSRQEPWEEWVNLILAAFLLVSPWLFGYAEITIATINAVASSLCVAVFALISMLHEYSITRMGSGRTS